MTLANGSAKLRVPMSNPSIDEADVAAVLAVLRTPYLSMGPKVREFEEAMAEYIGVAHGVAVNSGTSGLHLCMEAEGIGPGDEVVTTPFSFVASANCVLYQRARPVFADIDPVTLNLDPAQVEARITPKTKAIIAVDVFGQPAPVEALADIAKRHSLTLFQDSCEAIGAERNGHRIGSQGKAAVFAFYPNKQMTTGEGGMVVTDDLEFSKLLRSLCNQGRDESGTWMNHIRLGYNYRLDEMSAALGVTQVRRLDQILEGRSRVASWYTDRLRDVEGVSTPVVVPETTRMSWFVYVVRLGEGIDRTRLIAELEEDGVTSRPYFVPLHLQPLYRERFGHQPGEYPVTEGIARTTLALPFFTEMTEAQVDYVCARLQERIANVRGRARAAR